MSIKIFFLLCLISISNGETKCRTTAWWILQPFLQSSKEELTFNLSHPLAKYMTNDEYPVYFEFNQQNSCQESSLPPIIANATEQTFVEFKLEIPYLIRKNKTVMLKPLIYQNSLVDVGASRAVYGLPANFATMQADFENSIYSISYKEGPVQASFDPLLPTLIPFGSPETANFSSFVDANVSPWLAFPPLQISRRTKCASNVYDFTQTAHIRPVNMILKIIGDIFQHIQQGV